jgi:hypothetical protein
MNLWLGGNEHPSQQLHQTWCFSDKCYILYLELSILKCMSVVCEIIDAFSIEISV